MIFQHSPWCCSHCFHNVWLLVVGFHLLAAAPAGYTWADSSSYDAELSSETAIDAGRSASQCFCAGSRNHKVWSRIFEDLHAGLAADASFEGPWVHDLCAIAYPVIFQAIQVNPIDDSFQMHSDCPAAVLAMVIVCAQSQALQLTTQNAASPSQSGLDATSFEWHMHERVVLFEGESAGDEFVAMSSTDCRRLCDSTEDCLSIAHGPNGCHLKKRCVSSTDVLVGVDHVQTDGYLTHYRLPCNFSEGRESKQSQSEMENMMLLALRTLEICFHCLDESPWPFSISEILENYALMTLTPQVFQWIRMDGVDATVRSTLDPLPTGDVTVLLQPPAAFQLPSRELLARVRFSIRWHRGIESEVAFWRTRLTFNESVNPSTQRLREWLSSGEVKWYYEDPCDWLSESLARRALEDPSGRVQRPKFYFLNSGSGPFAPRPIECLLDRKVLPPGAEAPLTVTSSTPKQSTDEKLSWQVPVTGTDGLARFYHRLFDEHQLAPLFVPQQCPVEELHRCFAADHFDVVHMQNSLDHSFDPLLGLQRLLHVTQPGGWVLLRHARNEGVAGQFRVGLHQWSFDTAPGTPGSPGGAEHFIIWNPSLRVDVTEYLLSRKMAAEVNTELRDHPFPDAPEDEKFVWVDIRKPTAAERRKR